MIRPSGPLNQCCRTVALKLTFRSDKIASSRHILYQKEKVASSTVYTQNLPKCVCPTCISFYPRICLSLCSCPCLCLCPLFIFLFMQYDIININMNMYMYCMNMKINEKNRNKNNNKNKNNNNNNNNVSRTRT
jgi:hypothetical protein